MPSNHFILCCPLLPLSSIFPRISVFSNQLALCIRWAKYWSFSFSISPSNEYSGLISFRIDWFDLFAVQGTLKSSPTPQCKSINSLVLSLLYDPTVTCYWKNHNFDQTNLCQQSDVSAFEYVLQVCHIFSSKEQVSFNFMAAVTVCSDFGAREIKNKICHCFHFSPSICHEVMGLDAMILVLVCRVLSQLFHSPLSPSSRVSSSSLLARVLSSAYLR